VVAAVLVVQLVYDLVVGYEIKKTCYCNVKPMTFVAFLSQF
jgi:hypothetical protein